MKIVEIKYLLLFLSPA